MAEKANDAPGSAAHDDVKDVEDVEALPHGRSSFTLVDPFDDGPAVATIVHSSSMTLPPNIRRPRTSTELMRNAVYAKVRGDSLDTNPRPSTCLDDLFDPAQDTTKARSSDPLAQKAKKGMFSRPAMRDRQNELRGKSLRSHGPYRSNSLLLLNSDKPDKRIGVEMWPSMGDLRRMRHAEELERSERWGCAFWKSMSTRQKICLHLSILLVIVGVAVGIGSAIKFTAPRDP